MIRRALNKYRSSNSVRSSFWVIGGLVSAQSIRLASNLVLTRLLVPEYFGMMAILNSMIGLFQMVSDIGLTPAIVNTKRHDDPLFMRTAWTIQVVRSFLIGIICILAAYPIAIAYSEPQLLPLVIVAGLTVMAGGFKSVALVLEQKFLRQKPLVLIEFAAQIVSTLIMIAFAYVYQSVWALLAGFVCGELFKTVFSYVFLSNHYSRFCWDRDTVREIIGFGKWIFVASIFGYISTRSDVMIMGFWLSMDDLGRYSIAAIFASIVVMLANSLSNKVLHPHFKQVLERTESLVGLYRLRKKLNIGFAFMCCCLAIGGDLIIRLLYDERYWAAGWMLQILALGKIGTFLTATLRPLLLSRSDSFGVMLHQITYSTLLLVGIVVGALWRGAEGVIIVYAMIPLICHPVTMAIARRHKFHCVRADSTTAIAAIVLVLAGWILTGAPVIDVLDAAIHNRPVS